MNQEQLQELGLSESQAKAYMLLVMQGKLTPLDLMKKGGESRTNAYMVLERLAALGLAIKDEVDKKLVFRPGNPMGLQKLAERARERAYASEVKIKEAMPELLKFFNQHTNQPGVRFLQGREGLKQVYADHLAQGTDAVVFRTQADDDYLGDDLLDYLKERGRRGMRLQLISPNNPTAVAYHESHPELNREITWIPESVYTAPVEVSAYGSRVAITSFGEEAVATIIESPQIADAMRQIFDMAKLGATQMMKTAKK